jgi:hypothetical protein
MVPEVVAVGEEGTVLGIDEDEKEEGRAALAEVLAFGAFTVVLVVTGLDLVAEVTWV